MTGVVLAGGRSRRMGTDKALLDWEGVALVDRVAGVLRECCAEVLVASGDGRRLRRPGEIADAVPDAGPLGGVLSAMETAAHSVLAVVAVDMPHAGAAVLKALAAALDGADAAIPLVDGRAHPLHAVYAVRCAPALQDFLDRGERAVLRFLETVSVRWCGPEVWAAADPGGHFATNLNRPEQN